MEPKVNVGGITFSGPLKSCDHVGHSEMALQGEVPVLQAWRLSSIPGTTVKVKGENPATFSPL